MRRNYSRTRPRWIVAAAVTLAATIAAAMPAQAHTPVEISKGDVLPWQGPLILDGGSAAMLFGTLPHRGVMRAAQLHMQAGETLLVKVAIPDLAPENQLASSELPTVVVVSPSFKITILKPTMRIPITPHPGLNLLVLAQMSGTALAGDYSIIVIGAAPERFLVATGDDGTPWGGVARGSVATDAEVAAWYAATTGTGTPPSRSGAHAD